MEPVEEVALSTNPVPVSTQLPNQPLFDSMTPSVITMSSYPLAFLALLLHFASIQMLPLAYKPHPDPPAPSPTFSLADQPILCYIHLNVYLLLESNKLTVQPVIQLNLNVNPDHLSSIGILVIPFRNQLVTDNWKMDQIQSFLYHIHLKIPRCHSHLLLKFNKLTVQPIFQFHLGHLLSVCI